MGFSDLNLFNAYGKSALPFLRLYFLLLKDKKPGDDIPRLKDLGLETTREVQSLWAYCHSNFRSDMAKLTDYGTWLANQTELTPSPEIKLIKKPKEYCERMDELSATLLSLTSQEAPQQVELQDSSHIPALPFLDEDDTPEETALLEKFRLIVREKYQLAA